MMVCELVCGPPGSGKTTYCEGKRQLLHLIDPSRSTILINLDPANDGIFPYPCDIDIRQLITRSEVMQQHSLGPNGSYLYCIDSISRNLDWLKKEILKFTSSSTSPTFHHIIIDCPGQVEFYLNSNSMQSVLKMLQKDLRATVCVLHLTDATVGCRDVPTYISTCLLSLSCLVDLELPHINVMSKWDLVLQQTSTPSSVGACGIEEEDLDCFLATGEFKENHLQRLWHKTVTNRSSSSSSVAKESQAGETDRKAGSSSEIGVRSKSTDQWFQFSCSVLEVVDGYGLVSFEPLDVQDETSMVELMRKVDRAVGHFVM